MMALDTRVDRPMVLAVRATPPLAPAGTPRVLESLVVDPHGTIDDAEVRYSTCGLSEAVSVGVTDLRCFENPDLVTRLGRGEPGAWDVPPIEFRGCIPFDEVSGWLEMPGTLCTSIVPVLAVATTAGGEVQGANYVAIPASEVPEVIQVAEEGERDVTEVPTNQMQPVGSFGDPALTVTLTADGPAVPGGLVELEVTLEDPHYNRVAWWVTGGTLDQTGRTLVTHTPDGLGHAYNRWTLPDDPDGPLTVWVVLTEWFESWGVIPDVAVVAVSQPAWAELTLEVE